MAIKIKKKVEKQVAEENPEVSEDIAEPDSFVKASLGVSNWLRKNWKAVTTAAAVVIVLVIAVSFYLDHQSNERIAASSELTKALTAYNTPLAEEAAFVQYRNTYKDEQSRTEAVYQLATAALAQHGDSEVAGEAHLLAASAAQQLGKLEEANAHVDQALGKLDESVDVFALQARASVLADSGKTDEAAQVYHQIYEKGATYYGAFALMQIGLLQERAGKTVEAAAAFSKLLAQFPDDRLAADARRHLGVLVEDPQAAIAAVPISE